MPSCTTCHVIHFYGETFCFYLFTTSRIFSVASFLLRIFHVEPNRFFNHNSSILFLSSFSTASRGFQCGVCPYSSQCYLDYTSPTYYRCATTSNPSTLSPVGIAMICVGIFVFIVIVVIVAVIRRRRAAYATVEYTPGYGATVSTQPYPYYSPSVIVEPAPIIVSDFGHHHHHHGGYHHDAPAVGFSGGYSGGGAAVGFSSGGDNAAVGFSGGYSGGGAAVGFSN
jgi:hypothetical protein